MTPVGPERISSVQFSTAQCSFSRGVAGGGVAGVTTPPHFRRPGGRPPHFFAMPSPMILQNCYRYITYIKVLCSRRVSTFKVKKNRATPMERKGNCATLFWKHRQRQCALCDINWRVISFETCIYSFDQGIRCGVLGEIPGPPAGCYHWYRVFCRKKVKVEIWAFSFRS